MAAFNDFFFRTTATPTVFRQQFVYAKLVSIAVSIGGPFADLECLPPGRFVDEADTTTAADLLSLNKFGAIPVVDIGKLAGMISYIDFLKHYAANR